MTQRPSDPGIQRPGDPVNPVTLFYNELQMSTYGWRRGVVVNGVRRMKEVNTRRARLLPGWVTVFGRVYHLGM